MRFKLKILYVLVLLLQLIVPSALLALTPAPDITDREVVEKLAKLETGQKALNQRISDLRSEMKYAQEALNIRLDDLIKRLGDSHDSLFLLPSWENLQGLFVTCERSS